MGLHKSGRNDTQTPGSSCDMGEICIGCQPRDTNGRCPGEKEMISEVDLRDWDKVDFSFVKEDNAGRYNVPYPNEWYRFYEQVLALKKRQTQAVAKKIPAIERK